MLVSILDSVRKNVTCRSLRSELLYLFTSAVGFKVDRVYRALLDHSCGSRLFMTCGLDIRVIELMKRVFLSIHSSTL